MPEGGAALWAAKPTKKDTTYVVSFFVELLVGIEPTTYALRVRRSAIEPQ